MSDASTGGRLLERPDRMLTLAVVVTLVPIVVAPIRALARGWIPIGDNGLLLLRTQDVATSNHPLLGTWTSASLTAGQPINNPGPLWFDALAPFVRVLGPSVGFAIGVAVANGLAVILVAWLGRRAGGSHAALVVTALSGGLAWSMGSELLFDAWQPHAMLLPAWALLVGMWALATGDLGAAPWVVGVASLIVQTHLSFVYLVAIVGVVAIGGAVRDVRRQTERHDRPWRRPLAISGVVAVLAWIQPVSDQFAGEGNLGALLSAGGSTGPKIGPHLGIRMIGSIVAVPPWWTRGGFSDTIMSTGVIESRFGLDVAEGNVASLPIAVGALAIVVAVLIAVIRRARGRHDGAVVALGAIAVAALVASAVSMVLSPVNTIGLSPHQVRWLWPVALTVWAVPLVAAARWVERRDIVVAVSGAAAAAFAIANVPTYAAPEGPTADREHRPTVVALLDQMADYEPGQPILFDMAGLRFAEPYSGPIIAALGRQGVDIRFEDEGMVRQVGSGRRADGDESRRLVLLEGAAIDDPPPGAVTVARVDGSNAVALFEAPR